MADYTALNQKWKEISFNNSDDYVVTLQGLKS